MDRRQLALDCVQIEETGESVLNYLRERGCVSPWGTWFRLQMEELGRSRNQMTDGKGNEDMFKATQDQKRKAVEIALDGGNPLPYLKKIGSKKPEGLWYTIKQSLKVKDPETFRKLPERIGSQKKPELTIPGEGLTAPEEKTEPRKPLNYDGFEVTGLKTNYGRFQMSSNGYLYFGANDHDELEMPLEIWRKFAEDLPRVMAILGVDAQN